MKIIAFGDIHMATSTLPRIEGLHEADLVVVTGDITNFGARTEAKTVLNEILTFNPNLLCLAGNLDKSDVNDYLEGLDMNLHGQAHMIKRQVCIYGVGGSNTTPFQTPWELSENQLHQAVQEAYRQAGELIDLAEPIAGHKIPTIFVSHAPPYGTALDRLRSGRHVGSKTIRHHIEYHSPDLCITGHIHEAGGVDTLGGSFIVNPGMLIKGGWITIDIDKTTLTFELQSCGTPTP
jgi:hypothetical protein